MIQSDRETTNEFINTVIGIYIFIKNIRAKYRTSRDENCVTATSTRFATNGFGFIGVRE